MTDEQKDGLKKIDNELAELIEKLKKPAGDAGSLAVLLGAAAFEKLTSRAT